MPLRFERDSRFAQGNLRGGADRATSTPLRTHWQRDSQLRPTVAMGAHLAVFCTEDVPFIDRRAIPDLTRGTFIGRYLIDQGYVEACRPGYSAR
ncbi:MAG: hypothetical protein U1E87_03615 [Alphaproteobacteria bacterium]